jgi:autotransporter-associated beta strand protein
VGGGGLTKIGNGTLALGGANTYSGPTVVNVGALNTAGGNAIGDLSAVSLADVAGVALNLGANEGVGSLAGGGASGGNVNLNANRLFIGANNADTAYAGIISGTGGINKVGNGTLLLNTAHSFTGSIFGNRGALVLSNATVSLTAYVSIGQDTNDNATLTLKDSAQFTTTSDLNAGDLGASVGTINIQDNAQVTVNGLFVGSANAAGSTASGVINQTGGTLTEQNAGVGFFSIGGRGPSAGGVGVYNISGGTMTAAAGIRVGSQGTGTLNVSNTAVVNANGGFNTARLAGSTGTANFNGGTVNTLNFASSTGVNATNNFNGSTISPTVASTTFLQGLTRANIRNGGLLLNDNNLNLTINQALLHSDITGDAATDGGLNKSGSGTLTLTAASTYTGPTAITAGALVVNGSLGTNTVTVDSGASLSGNGLLNGPTVVNGTITPGSAIGVLTISNSLTLSPTFSSTAVFSFGPGTNSTIKVSGALNVPNATTINLNFINAVPPVGTNTLIRYGSVSGFANLSVGTTNPRYTFSLFNDTVAKEVKLVVTGVPAALTWLGDGINNYWDNAGGYSNWLNGVNPDYFYDGDNVTFNNNGSNNLPVSLLNNVFPASVTVNANKDYELAGTGVLASPGSLTKSGTGTLILSTSNSFAGSAVISAGTVQVGNGSTTGTLSASTVTNNSALVFNRSDTVGMNAEITGSGTLSQISLGGVQLAGSNSYSGLTLVTNGFVFPRNPLAFGSTATGTVATNGGQIYIDQNIDIAAEPLTLGGAAMRKGGGGLSTWGGPVTLTADTTVQIDGGASLNLTNVAGISGSGINLTVQGDGGSAGTIAGPLTLGTGGLTKGGSGTWTLGTNNNFTGLTAVNAGTLRISDNTVGNPAGFTANQVTLGGGTLTATTNVSFVGGNVGFTVTGTTGGFGAEAGATLTISNDISGSGTLAKSGAGTLALVGPNTFSGTLRLDSSGFGNDGAVRVTTSNALATVISPIYSANNNSGSSTLQLDGAGGGFGIAQGFLVSCRNSGVAWINNLAGNNTLLGVVQVEVGGGTLPFQSDAGLLTVANNIQYIGGSTNGRTYQFAGAGNTLVSGVILNGDNTAPVSVSKTGTGTLTLSAANTYLGATTINNGLLSLTGSINSTGAVSVVGGALGGNGTVNDSVTVGAAGAIAPGVGGIGTLTVNGNLALSGGLTIDVNKSASPTNDFISVSGTLANSGIGTVTVSNLGPALVAGNSFKLFSQPVVNGGTMSVTGGLGAGLGWTNNLAVDGSIAVIAVSTVATNPTNLVSSVSGTTLSLSWPSDHLGWFLQTQTNSRSVGLKPQTNFWFDVAGSQLITNTSITIERTNPTVFFRLRSP